MVAPPDTIPEPRPKSADSSSRSPLPRLNVWLRENRVGLLALAACGAFVFGWTWWRGRDAPHRVGEVPVQYRLIGFRDGEALIEPEAGAIVAMRLRDGKTRTLLRMPIAAGSGSAPARPTLTAAGLLYYVDESRHDPATNVVRNGQLGSPPSQVRYRSVSVSEMGLAKPVRDAGSYAAYLLPPGADAKPILIARRLNWPSVSVAGDTGYWVEQRHWTNVPNHIRAINKDGIWVIPNLPPCNQLMRARIGGPAEPVPGEDGGGYGRGRSGIAWTEAPRGGGPDRITLCYLSNSCGTVARLKEYRGEGYPVEHQGRLYWVAPTNRENSLSPDDPRTVDLISAPLDLTSTRNEGTLRIRGRLLGGPDSSYGGHSDLFAHGAALYALCAGDIAPDNGSPITTVHGGSENDANALYKIELRPRLAPRKLATFPSAAFTFSLDGGDLNAVATEDQDSLLDWSVMGLSRKTVKVVYRYHLPE